MHRRICDAGFEQAFVRRVLSALRGRWAARTILCEGWRAHREQRAPDCCDFERHPDIPRTIFDDCEDASARERVDGNP